MEIIHRDDIKVIGEALHRVNLIEIDWDAVRRRDDEEYLQRIARRRAQEEKENRDAAGN